MRLPLSEPLNRLSMRTGPRNRLTVNRKKKAISPARNQRPLGNVWICASQLIADPDRARGSYGMSKSISIRLSTHVSEHSRVKNDERHPRRSRFQRCLQVCPQIARDNERRVVTGGRDRGPQTLKPSQLLGPHQGRQPIRISSRRQAERVQIEPPAPSDLGKRCWHGCECVGCTGKDWSNCPACFGRRDVAMDIVVTIVIRKQAQSSGGPNLQDRQRLWEK